MLGDKKGEAKTGPGTTRAENIDGMRKFILRKVDKTIDSGITNCISVCGVKIKDGILKRTDSDKKTPSSSVKKKKENNGEEDLKTTPSINKISRYLLKKNEENPSLKATPVKRMVQDLEGRKTKKEEETKIMNLKKKFKEENGVKKTFSEISTEKSSSMKKKIDRYQEATENSDMCLIGSGRCAKHNTN